MIDPTFAEKDTPKAYQETYFRYFCWKKKHPSYAKKQIFAIFAENDVTKVYHEANFVTKLSDPCNALYLESPSMNLENQGRWPHHLSAYRC